MKVLLLTFAVIAAQMAYADSSVEDLRRIIAVQQAQIDVLSRKIDANISLNRVGTPNTVTLRVKRNVTLPAGEKLDLGVIDHLAGERNVAYLVHIQTQIDKKNYHTAAGATQIATIKWAHSGPRKVDVQLIGATHGWPDMATLTADGHSGARIRVHFNKNYDFREGGFVVARFIPFSAFEI